MLSDFIDSDIIHSDRRPQQNNGQRIYSFTEILWNDFPWDKEGFRLKNIRIRRTVSRKMKIELVQCAHYDLHTLHISLFPFSYYMPFLAYLVRRRYVNHVEGGSNPG